MAAATVLHTETDTTNAISGAHMLASAERAAVFLKSLSHPVRLVILCRLAEGPARVYELENLLEIPQAAVSKQLTRLRDEGLVRSQRDGRSIIYELADKRTLDIVKAVYAEFCD